MLTRRIAIRLLCLAPSVVDLSLAVPFIDDFMLKPWIKIKGGTTVYFKNDLITYLSCLELASYKIHCYFQENLIIHFVKNVIIHNVECILIYEIHIFRQYNSVLLLVSIYVVERESCISGLC